MSISLISTILGRIDSATPESPIAVFKTKKGSLNAVFASTIQVQHRIISNDPDLIGTFHGGMDRQQIRLKLLAA